MSLPREARASTDKQLLSHAGIFVDQFAFHENQLEAAKKRVKKGGRLDVVVRHAPLSVAEAEEVTRKLYAYAPRRASDLDYTVLLDAEHHEFEWEDCIEEAPTGSPQKLVTVEAQPYESLKFYGKYDVVALGGTWDHLHWGHRLMLTLAAYTAKREVVVGVTASELLKSKQYAEALDCFEIRERAATTFIKYLAPQIKVTTYPLHEMYGPTITVESISALVVSQETSSGGAAVNKRRVEELKWAPVDIIEVGLIKARGNSEPKLSSTDLRKEDLESRL